MLIHALEALARRQCQLGQLILALNAAYAAIAAESLRESAHAALVEIHLAEGNVVEARKQVDKYARLLWDEMRLTPSDALVARVPGTAGGFGRIPPQGSRPSVWTAVRDPAPYRPPFVCRR
jgi:hypothetical protein